MKHWEITETPLGDIPLPLQPKKCVFCGEVLLLHQFHANHNPALNIKHCDINMKCSICGWFVTFGVSLSDSEHLILSKSPLNTRVITTDIPTIAKAQNVNSDEIKKRLKDVGYWG